MAAAGVSAPAGVWLAAGRALLGGRGAAAGRKHQSRQCQGCPFCDAHECPPSTKNTKKLNISWKKYSILFLQRAILGTKVAHFSAKTAFLRRAMAPACFGPEIQKNVQGPLPSWPAPAPEKELSAPTAPPGVINQALAPRETVGSRQIRRGNAKECLRHPLT